MIFQLFVDDFLVEKSFFNSLSTIDGGCVSPLCPTERIIGPMIINGGSVELFPPSPSLLMRIASPGRLEK